MFAKVKTKDFVKDAQKKKSPTFPSFLTFPSYFSSIFPSYFRPQFSPPASYFFSLEAGSPEAKNKHLNIRSKQKQQELFFFKNLASIS